MKDRLVEAAEFLEDVIPDGYIKEKYDHRLRIGLFDYNKKEKKVDQKWRDYNDKRRIAAGAPKRVHVSCLSVAGQLRVGSQNARLMSSTYVNDSRKSRPSDGSRLRTVCARGFPIKKNLKALGLV